jgi:hypothetical protein
MGKIIQSNEMQTEINHAMTMKRSAKQKEFFAERSKRSETQNIEKMKCM